CDPQPMRCRILSFQTDRSCGFFCLLGFCSLSSSFLGTVIKPFARLLKRSKESGGSSQSFGTLMRLAFAIYTFFRLPRFWRGNTLPHWSLMTGFLLYFLSDQFFKREPLSGQSSGGLYEPISISPLASVESKSLFVEITEQVKRL